MLTPQAGRAAAGMLWWQARSVIAWSCGLRRAGAVGPCGGFVVFAAGLDASVEDAGEAAGDAAHRVVVAGVAGSQLVVVGAGAGGGGERGQRLCVGSVDEMAVAGVTGERGAFSVGGGG